MRERKEEKIENKGENKRYEISRLSFPGPPDEEEAVYNIPSEAVAEDEITLSVVFRANPEIDLANWTLPGLSEPLYAGNLTELFEDRAVMTSGRYSTDLTLEVRNKSLNG